MKFLDTNAILKEIPQDKFLISSITLDELENIKTSANKDGDVKYQARQVLRKLNSDEYDYEVIIFKDKMLKPIVKSGISITNDTKIIACGLDYIARTHNNIDFITDDLSCKTIAKMFFKNVYSVGDTKEPEYTGYSEVVMSDEQMCDFYSDLSKNRFGLLPNEYLVVRDSNTNAVDTYVWTGFEHRRLKTHSFFSDYFGEVKAMKGDIYQKMACDSLANNQITVLRGPAGTGKSYLGLGYLFSQLDNGKIDKIIVFCNTVATKGAARLGFYPGSRDEKLLDSQIGNLLASKIGDMCEVEKLIAEEKLLLLPLSDIRGFDTTGMNCGIYADEIQNTTIEMMKLMLQRIGEDSICVLCGDDNTQVDLSDYEGNNNGLRRMCEVFKGENYFGTVTLKNCHRSKIARRAELM